jgi:hypothetical protein
MTIACGEGSTSLAYSIDGIQWTAIYNTILERSNKAVWNGKLWVAVGKGTNAGNYWVATSYDGLVWTGRDSTILTESLDVAWNGSLFVAVGITGVSSPGIAVSADGITWYSVVSSNVFSGRIHAIEWTGVKWLAYGSGLNTTAVSSDGLSWQATATPNLCVTDCANILSGNIAGPGGIASSTDGANVANNAFDQSFKNTITTWTSASNKYNNNGSYIGPVFTTYDQILTTSGEYLEIELTNSAVCKNYFLIFSVASANAIPKSWILLGSNNGTTWFGLGTTIFSTCRVTS